MDPAAEEKARTNQPVGLERFLRRLHSRLVRHFFRFPVKVSVHPENQRIRPYRIIIPRWLYEWLLSNPDLSSLERFRNRILNDQYDRYAQDMLAFPGDSVFLDVGANLGLASLPVAAAGYRVVAIEPVRETFEALRRSIAMNGFPERIITLHAAAHEQNTKIAVFVPNGRPDNTSLSEDASTGNVGGAAVPEWVETVVLDDWLRQQPEIRNSVRFVKIDVQGGEIHVLRGLREFLSERRGTVRVECEFDRNLLRLSGKSENEMLEFMRDLGYRCLLGDWLIGPEDWSSLPDCDLIFE